MLHLDPTLIPRYGEELLEVNELVKASLRLITFSREHLADDLLDGYLDSMHDLQELLSVKNAQMEAQTPEEAQVYLRHLRTTMAYIVDEIAEQRNFATTVQLFRLFRSISPEAHRGHPNRFRDSEVQIGRFVCPTPASVPSLVQGLFERMRDIHHPILRAIYFHHELIRIHPFADGNGRVTRVAKNWMLMFELYPPIFINTGEEKRTYIDTLASSFTALHASTPDWQEATDRFFRTELERLRINAESLYARVVDINRDAHTAKQT